MFQVKKLLKYTQPPQIKCQSKPLRFRLVHGK